MRLIESLKTYRFITKMNTILCLIIIFYFVFTIIISYFVYFSIIDINNSIILPNGYYVRSFDKDNPRFSFSFGMRNRGLIEIKNLRLEVKLDIEYYNLSSERWHLHNLFQKAQSFGKIGPIEAINCTFIGDYESFDCEFLDSFWENYENLLQIKFLISLKLVYHYFFNTIPVQISLIDLDLNHFECPMCYS